MRVKQSESQQVRISTQLCEAVTKLAHAERRTFRAQLELMLETALTAAQEMETRKGATDGE
jgi:hypothetical protein